MDIVDLSLRLGGDSRSNQVEDLLGLARKIRESRWRASTRTARVLHDEVAQLVAAARTEALAIVEGGVGPGEAAQPIADYLERALERLRKEVAVLLEYELDVWELILQCHELTSEMQARAGLVAECHIVGTVECFQNLNAPVAEAALLVAREALRNAEQHANARHVELRLKTEKNFLEIAVTDDGSGLGHSRDGIGLTLLRDSVAQLKGQFEVRSINQVGLSGTVVTACFPLGGGQLMTKLLVIDDHWVVHEGLERVFTSAPDVFIVAKAQNLKEAFDEARSGADKIDVILLDAALRDESGIEAIGQLKNICTRAQVLVLSMLAPNPHAIRAFEQGANGFVSKGASPKELLEAVRTVAVGSRFVTSEVGQLLAKRLARHTDLSPRESEIVRFFTSGRRCGEIARAMALSPKTVSAHKASAMRKLGVSSDVDLIRWALDHGMA